MTLIEAKEILNTYTMPLTQAQLVIYKQAIAVVSKAAFNLP